MSTTEEMGGKMATLHTPYEGHSRVKLDFFEDGRWIVKIIPTGLHLEVREDEFTVDKQMDIETIRAEYHKSEVCMGEMLASVPADGLSLEAAFELYIEVMKSVEGDKFFKSQDGGEMVEL